MFHAIRIFYACDDTSLQQQRDKCINVNKEEDVKERNSNFKVSNQSKNPVAILLAEQSCHKITQSIFLLR